MKILTTFIILIFMLVLAPFSYSQHPVAEESENDFNEIQVTYPGDGITIAATLILPHGEGPHPGLVIAHGSERAPRSSLHYRQTAIEFVKRGVAVLIPDKRGVGESTGTYEETGYLLDKARDVVTSVEFLENNPEILKGKIGIIGFSLGGWTAPLAATISNSVDFVITVSGLGVTPREQNIYQRGQELLDSGYSEKEVEEISEYRNRLYTYYGTGHPEDRKKLEEIHNKVLSKDWFEKIGFRKEVCEPQTLLSSNFDFYRQNNYDPAITFRDMEVPMLALFGSKDRHIPIEKSVKVIEWTDHENKRSEFKVHIFEGAGHPLRMVKREKEPMSAIEGHSPDAYGDRPDHFWEVIFNWLNDEVFTETESNYSLFFHDQRRHDLGEHHNHHHDQ